MAVSGFAQNPDIKRTMHWYFGYGAGLDFSSGTAVADTTGMSNGWETCFAMSDTCGELLFYGVPDSLNAKLMLYNKNHQLIQNGVLTTRFDPTQSACVPQPNNDSLYYVFYHDYAGILSGKFYYAIVNMNANAGLGAVVSKDNVLLDSLASEKAGVTKHCNGIDYWIASKMIGGWTGNGNQLHTWQLTSTGLNLTPVISTPGNILWEHGEGYCRFSNDGSMAAVSYVYPSSLYYADSSYFEIYQFDNCIGIFSNPITIQHPQPYGLQFSPDDTKLYVSVIDIADGIQNGYVSQYNLSTYNQLFIKNSRTILDSGLIGNNFQLGIDGKIYVTGFDTSLTDNGLKTLGVINNPNNLGLACNYVKDQVDLLGKEAWWGLPYFPDSYFNDFNYTNCITGISDNERDKIVAVYPNPFDDYITIHYTEPYYLRLLDITSKLIHQLNVTSEYYQINTSNLEKGIYFINIIPHNKSVSMNQKITKP